METTIQTPLRGIPFQTFVRGFLATFNMSYFVAAIMFLLAFCIEIAPFDPFLVWLRTTNDYSSTVIKYLLLGAAILMVKVAPSRSPFNAVLTMPLAIVYIMFSRFLLANELSLTAARTPWVSLVLVYVIIVLMFMMVVGNYVFDALYRQLEECEREHHDGESHAAVH